MGRTRSPSLSFSPQQEKRGLWKALPPDADVLADVCKSQQHVQMHVCVHAFFPFFDAQIVYALVTFITCISETQCTAIKMH